MRKHDGFSGKEKYNSFLIFDNLIQLSMEGLQEAADTLRGSRREAENLTNAVCEKEAELGKRVNVS